MGTKSYILCNQVAITIMRIYIPYYEFEENIFTERTRASISDVDVLIHQTTDPETNSIHPFKNMMLFRSASYARGYLQRITRAAKEIQHIRAVNDRD